MAHKQQLQFVKQVSEHLASDFASKRILEIGSYDVNGSIRPFFHNSQYVGVDLTEGPGVNVVCDGDNVSDPDDSYDLTVSCECFEHNPKWLETFLNMYRMTKPGGIVLFTCATTGRLEHGTTRTLAKDSPGTQSVGWDYYLNLTEGHFRKKVAFESLFNSFFFLTNPASRDLYFVGQKKGEAVFKFESRRLKDECEKTAKDEREKSDKEIKAEVEARSRYPKIFRSIADLTLLPVRIAMFLPDRHYQNFSIYYLKIDSKVKKSIKSVLKPLRHD